MDYNKFLQSKNFKIVLIVIGALIVLLLVFKAGVSVGYRKANFSYRWGENYHRNFAGPRGGFLGDFRPGFGEGPFINAHGTAGSIIKIDGNTIVTKGRDNVEQIVLVKDDTTITRLRTQVQISDLKVDEMIIVIGNPNEAGQIEAKLIRVMPPPPNFAR